MKIGRQAFLVSLVVSCIVLAAGCSTPFKTPNESGGLGAVSPVGSDVEYCPPYNYVDSPDVDLSKPFLLFDILVRDNGSRSIVKIVGDELVVNKTNFGDLVRSARRAIANVEKIQFQGRKIVLEGGLAFDKAKIEFLADEIVVKDSAVIALLPKTNSQISLYSRSLSFSKEAVSHFDVRRRFAGDDFSDISKLLTVATSRFVVGESKIDGHDEIVNFLSGRFSLSPIVDFRQKIDASINSLGFNVWKSKIQSEGKWPEYSLKVWKSAFFIAPFSRETTDQITQRIDGHRDVFDWTLNQKSSFSLASLENAIRGGTDLAGNGPAWVTNTPISKLISQIEQYTAYQDKNIRLDFYKDSLERIKAKGRPDNSRDQEKYLEQQIIEITSSNQASVFELADLNKRLNVTSGLLEELSRAYQVRESRLKEHAEDLKRSAQDRAKIVSALATATSIVATAYTGNPATGAAAGGIIRAIGEADRGSDLWTSLSVGYQFYEKAKGPLEGMSKAVSQYQESKELYGKFISSFTLSNITIEEQITYQDSEGKTVVLKRDDALKRLAETGKKFSEGLNKTIKVYEDFQPEPAPIPKVLEEDRGLKDLGEKISSNLEVVKKIVVDIDAIQRSMESDQAKLVELSESLAELRKFDFSNSAKRQQAIRYILDGAKAEMYQFLYLVDLLRRSSYVEYGHHLPIDEEFVRSIYIQQISDDWDPTKSLTESDVLESYIRLIEERKNYLALVASRVSFAAKKQFSEYVENRGRTPSISRFIIEFSRRDASSNSSRFLKRVNDVVRDIYEYQDDRKEAQKIAQRRIEIPLDLKNKLDARYPSRLLQVRLLNVEASNSILDSDLAFSVDVDRVGNLRRGSDIRAPAKDPHPIKEEDWDKIKSVRQQSGKKEASVSHYCYSVDLRPTTTPLEHIYIPFENSLGQVQQLEPYTATNDVSFWYLTDDDVGTLGRSMMVTYPPAESRMYLRMRPLESLRSTWWGSAPKIHKLAFMIEIFQ